MHRVLGVLELIVRGDVRLVQQLNLVFMILNLEVDMICQLIHFRIKQNEFLLQLLLQHLLFQGVLLFVLQE
jgi:hypothetical protein